MRRGETHTQSGIRRPPQTWVPPSSPGPSSALPPTAPPSLIHSRTSQGSRNDGSVLSQALHPAAHGQKSQDRKAGPRVRTGRKGLEPSRGEDSGPGRAFPLQEKNPSGSRRKHRFPVCPGCVRAVPGGDLVNRALRGYYQALRELWEGSSDGPELGGAACPASGNHLWLMLPTAHRRPPKNPLQCPRQGAPSPE